VSSWGAKGTSSYSSELEATIYSFCLITEYKQELKPIEELTAWLND
jgi:hypothetical protein